MNDKNIKSNLLFVKKHILLSLFLIVFLLFGFGTLTCNASPSITYWSDYKTSIKPNGTTYIVTTSSELAWVAGQVNSGNSFSGCTIEMGTDIDLSSHYWVPIGFSASSAFRGIFDGNNHKISGMIIGNSYTNVGLFGYVNGSTIKDVEISSSDIQVTASCGGILAGCVYLSTISGCAVEGNISTSSAGSVGGLTGYNYSCLVINCSSKGSVKATNNNDLCIGGLVGNNVGTSATKSMIKNSYTTSTVTGIRTGSYLYIGGLTGFNYYGLIQNCYEAGTVSDSSTGAGTTYAGGFVGYNGGQYSIVDNYWWEGCGKTSGLGTGSANNLIKVTTKILRNGGTLQSGTYASYTILDALTAVAKSITGATGWAVGGGFNNSYPFFWNH